MFDAPATAPTAEKRARPFGDRKSVCWCCASPAWLYLTPTAVGVKLCCAKCCHDTFNCPRAGRSSDGILMTVQPDAGEILMLQYYR